MAVSWNVQVGITDIGCLDHFLAWVRVGRKKLEGGFEVKLRYQNGLRSEVHGFSASIKGNVAIYKGKILLQKEPVH